MNALITAIGSALTSVIGWVGEVVTALIDSDGALYSLLPVFAISVGISILLLGISCIRRLTYGA